MIITEGTAKIDNRKYKDTFHVKVKMIPFEEVENIIGHAPGGVCPFGINEGIDVYLDEMEKHEDIEVRGGVKLTREYIQHLKDENKRLEEQNKMKNEYLKKVVGR